MKFKFSFKSKKVLRALETPKLFILKLSSCRVLVLSPGCLMTLEEIFVAAASAAEPPIVINRKISR